MQKRKKKYERSPEVAFQIQERDFDILKLLYQYRFLNSQQIKMMIGFDTKNIQNRLNKMFHAGFVDRPKTQTKEFGHNAPMIYALANPGAKKIIKKLYGDEIPERLGFSRNNTAYKDERQMEHELKISEFFAPLYHVARKFSREIELIEPLQIIDQRLTAPPKPSKALGWKIRQKNKEFSCIPDGAFGFQITDQRTGKKKAKYYFLEVDQGSMPLRRHNLYQSSIYKKYLNYLQSYQDKLFGKNFGFKKVRILFITNSEARMKNMIQLNQKINRVARGLFKFSYFDLSVSLDFPDNIMCKSWFGSRGEETDLIS